MFVLHIRIQQKQGEVVQVGKRYREVDDENTVDSRQ
jgi:hypothetical protein